MPAPVNIRFARSVILGDREVVGHLAVAHVLRGMAAEAVIDEIARAALQRGEVRDVGVRVLQRIALARDADAAAGMAASSDEERAQAHHEVTRDGSGFVRSMRVYQGIARKNAK